MPDRPSLPRSPRVAKTMRPGQAGTLRLARHYGDALLCVRYREDPGRQTRYTTVELVVAKTAIQRRLAPDTLVAVHIAWDEDALRARVRAAGAEWIPALRHWRLPYQMARDLGLAHRIRPELPNVRHRA